MQKSDTIPTQPPDALKGKAPRTSLPRTVEAAKAIGGAVGAISGAAIGYSSGIDGAYITGFWGRRPWRRCCGSCNCSHF